VKCNDNVDLVYVADQVACQQLAITNSHPFYSFRHNAEGSGHKCMSSAHCDDHMTGRTNEWHIYAAGGAASPSLAIDRFPGNPSQTAVDMNTGRCLEAGQEGVMDGRMRAGTQWDYVLMYIDGDRRGNDIPNDSETINAGFQWPNSYYIGLEALQQMELGGSNQVQLCMGESRSCRSLCYVLTEQDVACTGSDPAGLAGVINQLAGGSHSCQGQNIAVGATSGFNLDQLVCQHSDEFRSGNWHPQIASWPSPLNTWRVEGEGGVGVYTASDGYEVGIWRGQDGTAEFPRCYDRWESNQLMNRNMLFIKVRRA